MSKLQLVGLSVVAASFLGAGAAHAESPNLCRVVSATDIGKPLNIAHPTVSGTYGTAPTMSGVKGKASFCTFTVGKLQIANSSVMTMSKSSDALAEFRAQTKGQRDAGHVLRHVSGPWRTALRDGNTEIYVLNGRHLLHVGYMVPKGNFSTRHLRRLAAKAIAKI
jgi:hypothetical protein